MSTESILKDFVINDVEAYERLMKDLDTLEELPRRTYEKPVALEEGEQLIKELFSR